MTSTIATFTRNFSSRSCLNRNVFATMIPMSIVSRSRGYVDRLLAAEALVLVYPVWNEGFPAILKGFFDRVFIPGVSFNVAADGALVPNLQKLRRLAAVCTYGANRTISFLLGGPPKRVVKRMVRSMPGHAVRCDYLAFYGTDHSNAEQRVAFLTKVRRTFQSW